MEDNKQQVDHPFSDAGFSDVTVGAMAMQKLAIKSYELNDPTTFQKFKEVAQFLQGSAYPDIQLDSLLRRKTNNDISNTDFVLSFVRLKEQEKKTDQQLNQIKEELSFYE